MPVYNEAPVIERVLRSYRDRLERVGPGSEIIVMDDASTDGTSAILDRLSGEMPLKVLRSPARIGHTASAVRGLAAAKNELIFYSDSDGQFDPGDLDKLLAAIDGADIVIGWRKERRDPLSRLFFASILKQLANSLFGSSFNDIDSSFRLVRRKVANDLLKTDFYFKEGFSAQFTIRAAAKGYRIREVPVKHFPSARGSNFLPPYRTVPVAIRMMSDLIRLKRELTRAV